MRSENEQQNIVGISQYREMRVLAEVGESPELTQRELSKRIGAALGLTNLLVRNLVQRGYIRATQAGWKRWLYHVTPEGFSRKIRLTAAYVHRFLDHYQRVRHTLREELAPLALHVESRVAIYGTGEFAELVYLGLKELGIEEIEIFEARAPDDRRFLGMPVRDVTLLRPEDYDRVVIAFLGKTAEPLAELRQQSIAEDKLVTFFSASKGREGV